MIKCEKGQGTIELVITFTILTLLIFGIVDFGRAFYVQISLENASREGARAASLGDEDTEVRNVVKDSAVGINLREENILISPIDRERGEDVNVSITYDFKFITPLSSLIGRMVNDSLKIKSTTVMRVE